MDDKNELAQIPFVTHKLLLMEEKKRAERYKLALIITALLLAVSNICCFLYR